MRHHPGLVLGKLGIQRAQRAHPDLDIAPLGSADLALCRGRKVREVAVLDADQIRFAQCEVEVELDEAVQCGSRIRVVRQHALRTGQQPGADADQQFDQ